MTPLTVVILSEALPGDAVDVASEALGNRGFEVFAVRPITGIARRLLPDGFGPGGRALIAFNALMSPSEGKPSRPFADFEVEKAAHLLCVQLGAATENLRVTADVRLAELMARELLTPQEFGQLEASIATRRHEMATDLPILADLSRFKYRAKVELVMWNGQKAVKKTFRRTALDAMRRELAFLDDVGPVSPVPPRVLARTDNAILFEYIENTLKVRRVLGFRLPVPLRLDHVRQLADFVRLVTERGWDPIDLTPRDNILIDGASEALRAIDFEFAHRRPSAVRPEDSYVLSGVPADATAARPLNQPMEEDPYPGRWRPFTGLSKRLFLDGPVWLQRAERWTVHVPWLVVRICSAMLRRKRHAVARDRLLSGVVLRQQDLGAPQSARSLDVSHNAPQEAS